MQDLQGSLTIIGANPVKLNNNLKNQDSVPSEDEEEDSLKVIKRVQAEKDELMEEHLLSLTSQTVVEDPVKMSFELL